MIDYFYYRQIQPYFREPKKKAYTMLGLTLLSLSIFGSLAIRPSLVTIVRLNKQREEINAANEQVERKIQALYQVQDQYKKAKKDLYLLDMALPANKDTPRLLEKLTLLSGKAHVTIKSIRFLNSVETVKSPELQALPLDIHLSGNFPEIREFLRLLENSLRQIDVKHIDFFGGGGGKATAIEARLQLDVYFISAEK